MRIWVTAVGIVSPLGLGADATFRALGEGRRAFGPLTVFDASRMPVQIAAEVPDLRVSDVAPRGVSGRWSRGDAMAAIAAREALRGAGGGDPGAPIDIDLVVGATTGGLRETEERVVAMRRDPFSRVQDPALAPLLISATVDRLREAVWPFRRTETVCNACSSGATALALAGTWLRSGRSTRVLAGGVDSLCRVSFAGFNLLGGLDKNACRPFDRAHAGMTLGEGAAFLLLERDDVARARGAEPIAELAGWALGSEARNAIQPEADGRTLARVMSLALARAGISPADVGYVNAHGAGGVQADRAEIAALGRVFEGVARRPAVSSIKGSVGHALGASPAMQAALTALSLARGTVNATAGLESPDPACEAEHVMGRPAELSFDAAVCNSLGFGGADASVVLTRPGRFELAPTPPPRRVLIAGGAVVTPGGDATLEGAHALLEPGPAPAPGPSRGTLETRLNPVKARRLDRASMRVVALAQAALGAVGAGGEGAGLVTGAGLRSTAFAPFLEPILAGDWLAGRPIDFPNLLDSSAAANASIYLELRGPVFDVSALECSGLEAVAAAADLMAAGDAEAMVAAGVCESEPVLDECLAPVLFERTRTGPVTDAGGALALRSGGDGAAEIAFWLAGAYPEGLELPAPRDPSRALVVLPRRDNGLLALVAASGWRDAGARGEASARAGDNESCGIVALVAAASAIAAGHCDEALVVDRSPHRWVAIGLRAAR